MNDQLNSGSEGLEGQPNESTWREANTEPHPVGEVLPQALDQMASRYQQVLML